MLPNEKLYTLPIVSKGTPITSVPKGSSKLSEQAKRQWYVDFSYYNETKGKMERFRITKGGNRIKIASEKLAHFNALRDVYKELLEGGWSPIDERSNERLKKTLISITLTEGKDLFEAYHIAKGSRKKTISSYLSKVNALIEYYGANKRVNEISDYEITTFLNHKEATLGWVGVTYVNSKIALNNYFKYLKTNKYITINPVTDTETRKKIRTESHQIFSADDFALIMKWLRANDPYMLLFCQSIYYTCIRPKELRYLQLKHIDLKGETITVPASIAKNKLALPVRIDPSLLIALKELDLDNFDSSSYLFGSTQSIIGSNRIGENTPYNRFQKCLKDLELLKKNYTLYSFKHLSNVNKAQSNWSLSDICAANRHSSIAETETYLKHLLKTVKNDKVIPPI